MTIRWRCTHLQVIQDVEEFVSSSNLEKCSIAHKWIHCSEWVPSEWETKQFIIYIYCSGPSMNIVWNQTSIFVRNNPSRHFCFKTLLLAIIHNNASSSEKVHPLFSSHIKMPSHICKWCLICAYFSLDSDKTTSLEKIMLWIEDLFKDKMH